MADRLQPEAFFRDRYGVSAGTLAPVLGSALARHADDGDLYFEFSTTEALSLEDGQVKKANKDVSQGVGVRVVAGEKTGYAYTDDVTNTTITEAARTAGHIASAGGSDQSVAVRSTRPERDLYTLPASPLDTPLPTKIALLEAVDRAARAADPRIKNVFS
jgi:TldD protein